MSKRMIIELADMEPTPDEVENGWSISTDRLATAKNLAIMLGEGIDNIGLEEVHAVIMALRAMSIVDAEKASNP